MSLKILSSLFVLVFLSVVPSGLMAGQPGWEGPTRSTSAKFPGRQMEDPDIPVLSISQGSISHRSPKSPGKAFILSLLVPGLGEMYAGSSGKGQVFMAAEAMVWSGFAAFEQYSDWKQRDYELYVASHAGVNLEGKNDDYFKNIGFYQSIWSYNEEQLRSRNMDDVYWDEGTYFWEWDSAESRNSYFDLKESSRRAHRRAINLIGAAVLNRFISAIDAVQTVKSFNKKLTHPGHDMSIDFKIQGSLHNPKALVVLKKNF